MIYPLILTGGSGTRLWPVSRKSYPKQFRKMGAEQTLFQQTVQRVTGEAFTDPVVMTGEAFRFIVQDQLEEIDAKPCLSLIEATGRNTAPAILAAVYAVAKTDPKALMLVLPSDHYVPDVAQFQSMVKAAVPSAEAGNIITFGVTPDRPETGYGYLEMVESGDTAHPVPLKRFVEKPDSETAEQLVASGKHLWNAGIFLFRIDVLIAAFETHAPDMCAPVQAAVDGGQEDLHFTRLDHVPWAQVEDISIDCAIMEKANNLAVQRFNGEWSDLGSWDAIWRGAPRDDAGLALVGDASGVECENTLIYRDDEAPAVMGLGLHNMVVVATKDAVLVADKSRTQDISKAVKRLTDAGESVATQTPRYHRPWGWYETLALGGRFQVKRIVVKSGGILSLQSHRHRSEHWVVVEGTARVTLDGDVRLVTENQSIYIPLGAKHRMENPGKFPMVLIEVQTGSYLGEDDITRFEDLYNRPERGDA
jgi:mannose-1-phosphate guanylyltransferase/mannose-6-phosphate isomerase